jgi:endoglucanase
MLFYRIILGWLLVASVARAQDGAFVPLNPAEMKPLTNHNSPAHRTAAHFMHGVNFGNYLEVPTGQDWGVRITTNDFDHVKAEGFDHVRVPTAWHQYAGPGPDFRLSDTIFGRVDFMVTNALARGLAVLVNIHGYDEFTSDPAKETEKFIALWRQIAAHYAAAPDTVVFELLNEPKDAATTTVLNPIYARVIAEIRKTNPRRTIVVAPGDWDNVKELKNLVLPGTEDNLMVTIHCYEPFYFTHQGASWAGPDVPVRGIRFPGPPPTPLVPDSSLKLRESVRNWIDNYNKLPAEKNPSSALAFAGRMKLARQWADHYGRPVYVGEYGAYTRADAESRANFYKAFRRVLAEEKLGWAIWDWNAGFRYWDSGKQEPSPGMREALFGK